MYRHINIKLLFLCLFYILNINLTRMMKNWFKDSEVFFEDFEDKQSMANRIYKAPDRFDSKKKTIAIIGIDETKADSIRREFYKTTFPFEDIFITDLGNVRNTGTEFIIPILKELILNKINVLLIGSDTIQFESQIKSFEHNLFNIAFVEKAGDILFDKNINNILTKSKNINKAKLIAYQTHLFNSQKLNSKLLNNSMRLGEYRKDYKEIEPVLRDIDMMMFNLDSIRYSEIPGIKNTSPSGLTSEEACQIMKYVGLNTKVNLIDIIGYDPKFDFHSQGAMLVSQLIWYYIDGLDQKTGDDTFSHSSVSKFVVELNEYNISLEFVQSSKTSRWWVKIPGSDSSNSYFIPCSEDDYLKATRNELSTRIFNELSS